MANRHLSRSIVLQVLFEMDVRELPVSNSEEIINRDIEEFAPGLGESDFIFELVSGVMSKKDDLDDIIKKAAPDWPLPKISVVDRNVLRIGLFELLFADKKEVPAKVAINESIELAKTFGGENSGRFVNGVLGTVYKELGEPGKDDEPNKKGKIKDIPYDIMPIKRLAGAVVYSNSEGQFYIALVHDVFGHWTLPKGKILPEVTNISQGARDKIKEEIGIDVLIEEELGANEYVAADPNEGKIRKQVTYFLAKGEFEKLNLKESGGLDDVRWFKIEDVAELNLYNDIFPIITKAVQILIKKK